MDEHADWMLRYVQREKNRRIITAIFASLLVVALVLEIWPIFGPPMLPTWNCETEEINIKTGQARSRRYRFFIKIREETEDTVLSKSISQPVDVADVPAWRLVCQFAPHWSRVSPHCRFHGALAQTRQLEFAFSMHEFSPADRAAVATDVLRLWQTSGSYGGSNDLINELLDQGVPKRRGETPPQEITK